MKKRWMALLLAAALMVSLTACGGDKQPVEEEDVQEGVEETVGDIQPELEKDGAEADQNTTVIDMEEIEQEPQIGQRPADTNKEPQGSTGPADLNEKPQSQPVEKPRPTGPA